MTAGEIPAIGDETSFCRRNMAGRPKMRAEYSKAGIATEGHFRVDSQERCVPHFAKWHGMFKRVGWYFGSPGEDLGSTEELGNGLPFRSADEGVR